MGAYESSCKDYFKLRHYPQSARVARLSGNVGQPDHVLADSIAGNKMERRSGAGEEWLAATSHDGVDVESILINKTKVG